jgi:pimeloyl-ACP methyl ester carboxylesterase
MRARQFVLILGLLMLFSEPAPECASAQTRKIDTSSKPAFVIVHGAWGGSWAFRRVASLLNTKGYTVYRPSLTGLGERVHLASPDVGLSTHIDDVVNVLLFEDLRDVILVGHSYGGMVITGVADRVPDRIRRLVYVDAFVPDDGDSVMSLQGSHAGWIKQMTKGQYIVPPWVRPDQPPPKDVPQPLKTFTEPIVLKNKSARQIPATYILTVEKGRDPRDDDFASQSERARARGWAVYQLEADHNPQWSAPETLVEMLDRNR